MSLTLEESPLRNSVRSRNDAIYQIVRDRICTGSYEDGHIIHEASLAIEFSVSRTPIREVLQRLVYEQLAETRNGVGTIVSPINDDLLELLRFRIGLVALIAGRIPLVRPAALDAHYARLQTLLGMVEPADPIEKIWPIWRAHHEVRMSMLRDGIMVQMDDLLFYRTSRLWSRWWRSRPAEILDALLAEIRDMRDSFARNMDAPSLFRCHAIHLQALTDEAMLRARTKAES